MKSLSPLSAALILAAAISAVPAALRAAPGAEQAAASPPTATSPAEPAAPGAATAAGSEGSADEASAAADPRADRRQRGERGERGGGGGQPGARLLEADTDKNGLISKEEWSVAGRPEQIFTMFDTNADGNLNMEELREGVRKIRERRGGS